MTIEEFAAQVAKREMPTNPMARIETYARELAEGASHGLWSTEFNGFAVSYEGRRVNSPQEMIIYQYVEARWGDFEHTPAYDLLVQNGYLSFFQRSQYEPIYTITKPAFDLLSTVDAANIFISYKRSESSSFALLVSHVLQSAGLNPFVDMQLEAGGDWRNQLHDSIRNADYFILLLAPTTLQSEVSVQEIEWAMGAGTVIVPIWHRSFTFKANDWQHLSEVVRELIADTHTIRVTEENPLAYNSALTELLNRFGVSR